MKAPRLWTRIRQLMSRPQPATGKRTAFAGAMFSRLTADWVNAWRRSATQETRYELRVLRDRARELARNSPFMARFGQLVAENVIGPDGIRLQSRNKLKDGTGLHQGANAAIETAFAEWSQPMHCDASHRNTLTELLSLAVSAWPTDGEILIWMQKGDPRTPFGFSLRLLDPDFLDELQNQEPADGINAIYQGVEVDRWGAPVAYHLFKRHPAESGMDQQRYRVPAAEIIHLFLSDRIGRTRGVPWAAPVLNTTKMLDGYYEAEVTAARWAAASPAAITRPAPENAIADDPNAGTDTQPWEAEPGSLPRLQPGEALAMVSPDHPTAAFGDFTRQLLHAIATGVGISYGTLTGDLSQANYSSMRVGMLAERDHWRRLQRYLIDHLYERVYAEWLKSALLNNQIPGITDLDPTRWQNVEWQPRGFPWIDPLKDFQGDMLEIAAGVSTLTRVAAERGRDLETVLQERKIEIAMLDAYGVPSTLATTITDRPAPGNPGGTDDPGNPDTTTTATSGKALRLLAEGGT